MAQINFTKAALDNLPLPDTGRRAKYQDARQPGLSIRVTATGTKTFYVHKRVQHGSDETIALGRYPEVTIDMARRRAAEVVSQLARGHSVVRQVRDDRNEMTLDQLFEQFMERHAKRNKRTWRHDESNYRLYLGRTMGKRKLSQVDRRSITALMDRIVTEGRSPVTAERAVLTLGRKLFNWARERSIWEKDNPFTGIPGAKKRRRARFLLPHELPRFFKAVALESNDEIRDFILLALLTGQRRGNVQAMKWRDIDLDSGVWYIDADEFKNGEHQAVPLTSNAIDILKRRRERAPATDIWVLPAAEIDKGPGHLVEPRKGWARVLARAEAIGLSEMIATSMSAPHTPDQIFDPGTKDRDLNPTLKRLRDEAQLRGLDASSARMDDLLMHDLRRSMGSWQAINGASLSIIGRSLGHKSPQATAIYARLHLDPVRDSMERAAKAMLGAGVRSITDSSIRSADPVHP
jgi:integrase